MSRISHRSSPCRRPTRRSTAAAIAVVALTGSLAGAAGASAKVRVFPPLGERHASLVPAPGGRSLRLTAKAARAYRHGQIALSCGAATRATPPNEEAGSDDYRLIGAGVVGASTVNPIRPRMRIPIPAKMAWCTATVRGGKHGASTQEELGVTAVTAAGLAHLRERGAVSLMQAAILFLGEVTPAGPPTTADVAALLGPLRVLGRPTHALVLGAPTPSAPIGRLGIWTDGARSYATATLPDGRRLYLDQTEGTNATSTNVLPTLLELQHQGWPAQ